MIKNLFCLLAFGIFFIACSNPTNQPDAAPAKQLPKLAVWTPEEPGTKVASYEKAIKDDLNKGKFEVNVYTTDSTVQTGEFRLELIYGGNENNTLKIFPKWYEKNVVKPAVKPLEGESFGAIVGFDPGDGTFKELFEVKTIGKDVQLKQTKLYSIGY